MTAVQLALSSGDGLLARRRRHILFVGEFDEVVCARFVDAADESVVESITDAVDEQLTDAPFVVIELGPVVRLVMFGDLVATSDHRSLPQLNAAGAGTWIERTLRLYDADLVISAGRDDVNDRTDLVEGVVPAGGFRLTVPLSLAEPSAPAADPPPPPISGRPGSIDARWAGIVSHEEPGDPQADPPSAPLHAQSEVAVSSILETVLDIDPASSSALSPDAGSPESRRPTDDEASTDTVGREPGPLQPCESAAPSKEIGWELVFNSNRRYPVAFCVVIGRQPRADFDGMPSNAEVIVIEDPKLSKTHLVCTSTSEGVRVRDVGSTNGWFALPSGTGEPIHLGSGREMLLEDGALAQAGDTRFTIRQVNGAPEQELNPE